METEIVDFLEDSTKVYEDFDKYNLVVNVLVSTSMIIIFATGTILNLGILFYERNEEDPKKRGILNQVNKQRQ